MDKIDRLLDAMENPEHYSVKEIEAMLQDPEVKETFDMLDKTKSSLGPIVTPDIENEWEKFVANHLSAESRQHSWMTRLFSRKTAASIAIGIASVAAVAAIVGVSIHNVTTNNSVTTPEAEKTIVDNQTVSQPDTVKRVETMELATPEIQVFDDETLEAIMERIGTYYGYEVIFRNNAAKTLRLYYRWNQALPIEEIVESLNNFEQIALTVKDKTLTID